MGAAPHATAKMATLLRATVLASLVFAACGPDVEPPEPTEPIVPKAGATAGEEEQPRRVEPDTEEDGR